MCCTELILHELAYISEYYSSIKTYVLKANRKETHGRSREQPHAPAAT